MAQNFSSALEGGGTMSHAYARNYVHITFAVKGRRRVIKPPIQQHLWLLIADIARSYGVDVRAVNGGEDHVHLLINLPPKVALATVVRAVKQGSSTWMNENGHLFHWQVGYAAFSVSVSNLPAVDEYVRNQAEHHKKRSFEQEFAALLAKHGIEFTPGKTFL
jgi:REP element-mobilizing transposase RayT